MKTKRLGWDSLFFNLEVAEAEISSSEIDLSSLQNFDLIYTKSAQDFQLDTKDFTIGATEEKVVFSKNLTSQTENFKKNAPIHSVFELESYTKETLYDLAFESGKYSRFKIDTQIPKGKFEELYRLWIDNSLNKSFADFFVVWIEETKILGFVTLKLHPTYGQIGLIAVAPNQQGKGIGTQLIKVSEEYCTQNNIFELKIPTQKQNVEACSFYHKLGYKIVENTYIKHVWKNV